ncbi:MAG: ArsR family transcriptional regulator, partial [Thermoplasmata archaeon]|nr:helix-turn-helix transcriptional regulator [Thermoplasmata archaeon]NIS13971.1 helix-turn-helix transcriptional regulator [Thermoplasmata archaeon]NIS21808.1 helix-turn-helix transcriptional regulator [Thermoplasmata archaeon]NIT75689.1 helix-turn-helix transcriptional regulator [Thermoplasmata archaeon]NIU50841.1 helix-turn-helix transcriptional regulator [Thermoplasmata archaeon]
MAFRMVLVNHTPPTASSDVDAVAAALLRDVGLLPGGLEVVPAPRRRRGRPRKDFRDMDGAADPPRPGNEVLTSVPYRMLMDCFFRHPDQGFTVERLCEELEASRPTVYRHLLRLRELDLLAPGDEESEGGGTRRSYHLRFGRPSQAWRFAETNAECAMYSLRQLVDLVWKESQPSRRKGEKGPGLVLDHTSSRVSFHLPLTERTPMAVDSEPKDRLVDMMEAMGYLTPWSTPRDGGPIEENLAYRLFKDCLMDRPDRTWTMRELMAVLDTSKPTLYRHLKKLEALDLMERGLRGESPRSSKAFRIRYGDL